MLTSIVDILISLNIIDASSQGLQSSIKILKVLRVARLLKLVKNVKGIQRLVQTISFSIPSLMNAASLLFLSFFIFSILFAKTMGNITYTYQENGV